MSKSVNFLSEVLVNNFPREPEPNLKRSAISFNENDGGSFVSQNPGRASLKRPISEPISLTRSSLTVRKTI